MDADDQSRTDKSAENNGNVEYKRPLGEIRGFRPVKSNDGLAKGFVDKYTTDEQQKRDKQITRLLKEYTKTYKKKSKSNRTYKVSFLGQVS